MTTMKTIVGGWVHDPDDQQGEYIPLCLPCIDADQHRIDADRRIAADDDEAQWSCACCGETLAAWHRR